MFRVKRAARLPQVQPEIDRGTTGGTYSITSRVDPPATRDEQLSPIHVTTRYSTPPVISTEEVIVQKSSQPQTTTTTSTRIIDSTMMSGLHEDSFIEETKTTTTVIKPVEIPPPPPPAVIATTTTVPQVNTTTVVPAVETTTIRERPIYRPRRRRTPSTITVSSYTTTTSSSSSTSYTTESTVTPRPHIITQRTVLPPRPPIETTVINEYPKDVVPQRRIIRQVRRVRTYSGYYSSDLEYGKQKVYKSDYKYRHYYYCNWCKGRCDLPNSSCSCCEWFYGCPVWGLLLLSLFFLALIVTFFTLLGLQPSINSARRSETVQTKLTNRTEVIYGYLQNCGYQTGTWTTLVLCTNTGTTSTVRVALATSVVTLESSQTSPMNLWLILFIVNVSFCLRCKY